jgi:HK97 family phage portal protein
VEHVNLMDSIRSFFGFPEKRETLELNKDDQRLLELLGVDLGSINVKGKNALKVAVIFACKRILSESISKLPLKVYQEDNSGITKAAKHHLYELLKLRPNPYMSASDFWKAIEAHRCTGNAYASIEFDPRTGRPIGLWPMDSSKVKVMVDDVGLFNGKYKLWYEVDVGKGETRKLMPDEILHFKGSITLDGLVGIPTLEYLQSTIENAAASNQFINNFFKQGLQVKGLIQYVGDLDEDAKKRFRDKFEEMSSGLKNSHRIALMPVGYQFTPMGLNMTDAQFLENTELTLRQIANAFGIKMHQLNDLSRATHTNIEQQQREFYVDTLQPILTMYEQELTWKLFLPSELSRGYYAKFNVDAILRADIKTRYESHGIGIEKGCITPNEARASEDKPPLPGGDQLIFNGNAIPITMAGQQYLKGGGGDGQRKGNGNEGNSDDSGNTGNSGDE